MHVAGKASSRRARRATPGRPIAVLMVRRNRTSATSPRRGGRGTASEAGSGAGAGAASWAPGVGLPRVVLDASGSLRVAFFHFPAVVLA